MRPPAIAPAAMASRAVPDAPMDRPSHRNAATPAATATSEASEPKGSGPARRPRAGASASRAAETTATAAVAAALMHVVTRMRPTWRLSRVAPDRTAEARRPLRAGRAPSASGPCCGASVSRTGRARRNRARTGSPRSAAPQRATARARARGRRRGARNDPGLRPSERCPDTPAAPGAAWRRLSGALLR